MMIPGSLFQISVPDLIPFQFHNQPNFYPQENSRVLETVPEKPIEK